MTTTMRVTAYPSHNPARGFAGRIGRHVDANEAWHTAIQAISSRTGRSPEVVGAFLDGRYGREFAHEVAGLLIEAGGPREAIVRTAESWMDRRIDTQLEDELGIPEGLPYLIGLVCMHEARLEASAS